MQKRITLYYYAGKDHLKNAIENTILESSEDSARRVLKASDVSIDSIRPILTKKQKQLVMFYADYNIIDYFKDVLEDRQADFGQLINQGYVHMVGERKNYHYKLGKKSLLITEKK